MQTISMPVFATCILFILHVYEAVIYIMLFVVAFCDITAVEVYCYMYGNSILFSWWDNKCIAAMSS